MKNTFINIVKKNIGRTIRMWWFARDIVVFIIIGSLLLIIYPVYKIKFVIIDGSRIGPLITDSEMVIRTFPSDRTKTNIHYIGLVGSIVSEPLKKILQRQIPFVVSPLIHGSFKNITNRFKLLSKMPFVVVRNYSNWASTFNQYKSRIEFTEEEKRIGEACLREMGIGENDWFICFHAREAAYLDSEYPDIDWSYHNYRDSSIYNCINAAQEIVNRGGFAVRVGSKGDTPLRNTGSEKIIDYANSKFKSQFMDIYLAAKCRFMVVGGGSGIGFVSTFFDVPVGWANVLPIVPNWWQKNNMFIPKLYCKKDTGSFIKFSKMDDMRLIAPVYGGLDSKFIYEKGLKEVENTNDEISALCLEMLEKDEGIEPSVEISKLQGEFRDRFFGKIQNRENAASISGYFLKKHSSLMD